MTTCDNYSERLGPYLDGELDPRDAAAVEAHLLDCPPCAVELRELRGLKRMLARLALGVGPMPAATRDRLRYHADGLYEQRGQGQILWIARALSAAAACILVTGALWLTQARQPAVQPMAFSFDDPADAVVMPVLEPEPSNPNDLTSPEWVLGDLTGGHGDE